jgi:hypothetical protein
MPKGERRQTTSNFSGAIRLHRWHSQRGWRRSPLLVAFATLVHSATQVAKATLVNALR